MAITKERRAELLAAYEDFLGKTDGVIITEYKGMSVAQISELRGKLREVQGRYVITKNTLFKLAMKETGWPVPEDLLVGTTGVVLGNGNFPTVAKSVLAYAGDHTEIFAVKGGVFAGMLLNAAQVETVSNLPSLDELRAQLAGLIVQPAAGLVSVLNAGVGSVAQVIQAYVQKQEEAA